MNISNEKKEEVITAAKEAAEKTYKATATKSLKWWERLLWIALATIAAAASTLFSGCGHSVTLDSHGATICKDGTCLIIGVEQRQEIPVIEVKGGK